MYQIIVFLIAALLCVLVLFLFRGRDNKNFDKLLKCLTVAFCAVGCVRLLLSDSFIYVVNGGLIGKAYHEDSDVLQTVLRWGYFNCYSVIPMAVFFNSRFFRNVASYVSLPFAVLSTLFFDDYMEYFLSSEGSGIHMPQTLRYAFFVLELVLAIMIPILIQIRYKHYLNVKDLKEIVNLLIGIPFILLATMPVYVPQSLIGYGLTTPKTFGSYHIVWIAVLFVAMLALYYAFRFRSHHDRYLLCMFLTLVLFFQFTSMYLMGINIKRLPFQLCHIAAYFYLVVMIFKLEKMFHFCFLANMVGALIAILAPDFPVGDFSFWTIHFVMEHTLVLAVPAMIMGLRIFPRLHLKSLKYFFVGFTSYFVFAFVLGTVFNGYSDVTGQTVNYFYMFDRDLAFEYVPFLTFTENFHYAFGRFEVYPIIILLVYVGFSALCFLYYLLIRFCYRLEDDHLALRRSGIELYEKITHKTSRRPKQYVE